MSRTAWALLGPSILVSACGSSGTAVPDAGAPDASMEADAAVGSQDAGDGVGHDPSIDAEAEASYSCTPPGVLPTVDDAGNGCTQIAGIFVNNVDVCTSSEYAMVCGAAQGAPAALQCQFLGFPEPQGAGSPYCCPCVLGVDAGDAARDE